MFSAPAVYRFAQRTIGSDHVRKQLVGTFVRANPGDRVLDIGCGTGDLVDLLPPVDYLGFDPSDQYIDAAVERYGNRGEFRVGGVQDVTVDTGTFDLCIAKGVLHHLDDDFAGRLIALAFDALRPGGRLVTIDPTITVGQSPIARRLAMNDRGQNVREPDAYASLAAAAFDDVDLTVRHDLLRVPYSHALLVCTK